MKRWIFAVVLVLMCSTTIQAGEETCLLYEKTVYETAQLRWWGYPASKIYAISPAPDYQQIVRLVFELPDMQLPENQKRVTSNLADKIFMECVSL